MHGKKDYRDSEALFPHRARHCHAVRLRHIHVKYRHVRPMFFNRRQCASPVVSLSSDLQPRVRFENDSQPSPKDRMIVRDHHANLLSFRFRIHQEIRLLSVSTALITIEILVPIPEPDSTLYFPPSILTRSAMPVSPKPPLAEA